jgi:hypothetical protein
MKTLSLLAILILSCAGSVRSADETPATDTQAAAPTSDVSLVNEKNKSTFTLDVTERNPFWPIGWKPVAKASVDTTAGPSIPPSTFLVSSITLGGDGERFAIINGKVMQEGQQFGLQLGNQTYQITVKSIQDGQVVLSRRDEEIVVPLRRK